MIEPAVAVAAREGIECHGPLPSDTVFVRARKGEFDAVLTMYHDQGQVAMKLIGFDQGITLLGGFPFPLLTAAHGSAYDIAGKGVANPGGSSRRAAARRENGRKAHGRKGRSLNAYAGAVPKLAVFVLSARHPLTIIP